VISLRDLLLTGGIVASLPVCFARPWIGVLVWTWFGTMTPHKLTWGFAYDYPFAQIIAIATMAGIPFARDRQPLPRTRETYLLLSLWALFTITTVFAMHPDEAWEQWNKVSKILLFTTIGLVFLQDRLRLRYLALVLALSIGFFGLKGGLSALMTGGANRLEAPEGSFIGGNTGLALGLDMALPFLFFLARQESNRWLRRLLWLTFVFSIPAVVFTYSRGGLIGLAAVLLLIAAKHKRQFAAGAVFVLLMISVLTFAPPQWFERVDTIANYEGDASAMSRLTAWNVAFRFTLDHPLLGGGFFAIGDEAIWMKYSGIKNSAVPHSIWFTALSDHGFPGLILFASLIICCILTLRRLRKGREGRPPATWVVSYSDMLEASIVGYAVAGTFLSATYMDVFYWLVALVIVLDVVAAREMRVAARTSPTPLVAVAPRPIGGRDVRDRRVR
jgi:probable O-glycosylation ligase (exosortase A-associated)